MAAFLIALLVGAGQYFAKLLFSTAIGAGIYLITSYAVPSWLSSAGNPFANLDPGILYFAQAAHLPLGLSIIGSAMTFRFSLRRAEAAAKAG